MSKNANTAFTGANVLYLEELANDALHNEHEMARMQVVQALKQPAVIGQSDETLTLYQHYGARHADLNPLANATSSLPKHDAYAKKYCGKIAFEYKHIACNNSQDWWQAKIDARLTWQPEQAQIKAAYTQLEQAEQMEHILSRKFVGQTRFSLEGCDSLIPLLESILEHSATAGVAEVVLGMPHRGRLNVMQNVMGMRFDALCDLYSGVRECVESSSDVTYHMGYSSDREFAGKKMHLSLAFNPSHLEFIVPVVMGSVKARQVSGRFETPAAVLPLVMHGDAAVAGQGVVAEWFNMMHTKANDIGGAIHVVVNNQLGFTTDNAVGRSGFHPTDAHKYADVPVIHVNADDINSVLYAAKCAAEYRAKFAKSVIINLVGYRRYGHNEGDDPNFTQPEMYKKIKQHPSVLTQYRNTVLKAGIFSEAELDVIKAKITDVYKSGAATIAAKASDAKDNVWANFQGVFSDKQPTTKLSSAKIKQYTKAITDLPAGFTLHKQIEKLLDEYNAAAKGNSAVRWGFAELLAYASLLDEGFGVRLVGQDVERGTFSHRHAIWQDQKNYQKHSPLATLAKAPKQCEFYNSTLSEQAVVAYEYGYSLVEPNTLTIWEAQYGDFCNGAQIIIDQFISSSWQKWKRMSGLVMLLPHGYEGAGPEHSSARLERFLQLAAEENMRVCMPSNAAQIFHLLRLQMHQKARVPLIVMSPKSSLRLPAAMSDISDFTNGEFATILPDTITRKTSVTRVILCSGKVYYDLEQYRKEQELEHVAIIRIEQLYPFDEELCQKLLASYKSLAEVIWCQEEPRNQGSWYTIRHSIEACLPNNVKLACVSRGKSASPAAGYKKLHQKRQSLVIENAFKEI